jgi:hypothetical protein
VNITSAVRVAKTFRRITEEADNTFHVECLPESAEG